MMIFADHGHRAEHRRRLRGPARPRLRRVLRVRRVHGGVPGVAPLRQPEHRPVLRDRRRASRASTCRSGSSCPLGMLVAATFGALLGAPTLRLRGDYLAIVTLGFGEIVPVVFKNLGAITFDFGPIHLVNANLTGGNARDQPDRSARSSSGSSSASSSRDRRGLPRDDPRCSCAIIIARNLEHSRMGRAWMAIREDETAAEMMGVNTVRTKLLAFALGRELRRCRRRLPGSYQGLDDVRLLPVLDLDPGPDHGHPRRDREHLGRDRRRDRPRLTSTRRSCRTSASGWSP